MDEGERGREALYIGCVNMPTVQVFCSVFSFREKEMVVLLGDFDAIVGKSVQIDDIIGMFRENTFNASGN